MMKWLLYIGVLILILLKSERGFAQSSVNYGIDSLSSTDWALQSVGKGDPNRTDQLADRIRELVVVQNGDFMRWLNFVDSLKMEDKVVNYQAGEAKSNRELWVIYVLGSIGLFLGLVNISFPAHVEIWVKSYYDNMLLTQVCKEEHLFRSWPFLFLYILFGFSTGLFIYLAIVSGWFAGFAGFEGVSAYLTISLAVLILFSLKILFLRLMGFVFSISKIVRNYVTVLYLSYFNTSLIILPFVLICSLISYENMVWVIPVALMIVGILLLYRGVRVVIDLLRNNRFSKFYLFMYLCTLEIAPVLILIKILS